MPFISFSCLIVVARISNTMLNRSGKSGHPCLVPDLRGKTCNFSPLSIMLAMGLSYVAAVSSLFGIRFHGRWGRVGGQVGG